MPETYDIIIRNGRIVDGAGNPAYTADIGIRNGKIVSVRRRLKHAGAKQIIDADHRIVAPGFIDAHSHDDFFPLINPTCEEKVVQGVTTTVIGNCGSSPAPMDEKYAAELKDANRTILDIGMKDGDLQSFDRFLNALERTNPGINIVPLMGHGTLRIAVMGMAKRPPTRAEMTEMMNRIAEAMQAGAFGLSTGLSYVPGEYADAAEIVALAQTVADLGGIYTSHIRDERDHVLDAIEEAVSVGERAHIPVQISHLKVAGTNNWGRSREAVDIIEKAICRGVEVTCDIYPYNAASTSLTALLPPDLFTDGYPAFSKKIKETAYRRLIIDAMEGKTDDRWENKLKGTGFDQIVIIGSTRFQSANGRTISDIAAGEGKDPHDVIFDIIEAEGNGASVILFAMDEADIRRIMKKPYAMIGSDGGPKVGRTFFHPRFTGTFPRVLGRYVRQDKVLSLEDAVRKMTSLPAQTFRLEYKGVIKTGLDADIVIFDPDTVSDRSTFENPSGKPDGVDYVIVNGVVAVEKGTITGQRAGKVLRKLVC